MKLVALTKNIFSALCFFVVMGSAFAYPDRPVKVIVGYPPGGTLDVPARILVNELSQLSGQSFIIENKPGASASIAGNMVATAKPDGYTLLLSSSAVSSAGAMLKQIPFDPIDSFAHVGMFTTLPTLIVARFDFPAKDLQQVIKMSKQRPGAMTYGSPGVGTGAHMAGEVLNKYAGVDIKHIPFKGSAQSLNNLMGGHVDLLFGGLSSLKTALDGKQIKVLAVTNAEPSPELVDAPTVAQALPDVEFPKAYMFTSWLGISAPAGTPDKIVEKLGNLMQQALENPQLRQKLINVGVSPGYVARQEMVNHIRTEVPAYIRVVKDIGITN